jgi:glutamate-5-semialdehyde dehydrogenase
MSHAQEEEINTAQAQQMASAARNAARHLRTMPPAVRRAALSAMADALERDDVRRAVSAANARDVAAAEQAGLSPTSLARLHLPPSKLSTLSTGMRQLVSAPDPLGRVLRHAQLAGGLVMQQRTVPIGVLLVIFESRPDGALLGASFIAPL